MLGARKGYESQWSTELYAIAKSAPEERTRAGEDEEGQSVNKRCCAHQLQKVDRDGTLHAAATSSTIAIILSRIRGR